MPGYWEMLQMQPDISNAGNNFMQTFLAAQQAKRQQIQQERNNAIEDRNLARQDLQDARQERLRTAVQKFYGGDESALDNEFGPEKQQIEAQRAQLQATKIKTAEDTQQIRDNLLRQGLEATATDPKNWYGFRNYAIRTKMFGEDELSPEPPSPDKIMAGLGRFKMKALVKEGKDPTMDLRKEFQGNQVYKDTQQLATAYNKILSTSDTGAGDMSLIFAYMKMLDPGSTVREGEYATAQNVGSIPQNIVSAYNRAVTGEKLAPEIRQAFKDEAGKVFSVQKGRYDALANEYRRLSTSLGVDPMNVVLDIGIGPRNQNQQQPSTNDIQSLSDEQIDNMLGEQ